MRTISTLLCLLFAMLFICPSEAQTDIQRVRLDFENSQGYTRHLLLGFDNSNTATDGFDYGYDALNPDNLPDDLNWMIEENRYVIQGVGAYNSNKYYPLGMFLSNSGNVTISLNALENFEESQKVYLYDLELNTYTPLNSEDYINNLLADTYLNRFYVTFSNLIGPTISSNNLLSTNENELQNLKIWHSNVTNELFIKGFSKENETSISLYNIEGKKLIGEEFSNNDSNSLIKLSTLSFSAGLYILKIDSSQFSRMEKVCIIN